MTIDHFTLTLPRLTSRVVVTSATGQETMNGLYRFDVSVLADADADFARRALETPATLIMAFGGAPVRAAHGIVSACRARGRDLSGATIYTLRIVPRMARLKKRRTSRIFQDLTTREVVERVLAISRLKNRWHTMLPAQKRAYCVQYDETDYAFVARLCAADGIFFSFEHPIEDGAEEIVSFSDTASGYAPVDGDVGFRFRPPGGDGDALAATDDHVQCFHLRHAMRSKRVLFRRFDFEKPPIPRRDVAGHDGSSASEDGDSMRAFVDDETTIYEHQQTREQALLEPITAQTALEAETADAVLAEGETAGRRLMPGRRFHLDDHVLHELDGDYVVVSCEHECVSPQWAQAGQQVYRNRFVAVPASTPFRTARPRRRVRQSLETATVVGPAGEEIHTDELGRVKVQFHWDLQGRYDEHSSCWLRVLHPWAGAGYGVHFLPRVGHEVLVGYIDGDADRPVVLGSLHNGLNQTPYTFPRDKTRSGIKTWTSPNGQGGHELVFEDKAGSELVALRSNRTLALTAAEDSSLAAERDLRITAGHDRTDEVLGDAQTRIAGDEQHTTESNRRTMVGKDETLDVAGARRADIGGHEVLRVKEHETRIVGGGRTTVIGATPGRPGSEQITASGRYSVGCIQEMTFESERCVKIICGRSKIVLHPDRIVLDSPTIQIQAEDRIALLQGDPPAATLVLAGSASLGGGTVSVAAGGKDGAAGKLFLDADAHLDGALVKLNCGPMGGGGGKLVKEADETGMVSFTVLRKGIPADVTSVTLVIATPTGEVVERDCAVGGSVTMEGKKGQVFTVIDTRIKGKSVPVEKKTPAGD